MAKVKYILLDCDNTLCQSEKIAFGACADLTNQLMKAKNIDEHFTADRLLEDFVGYNFRRMLIALQEKLKFSMSDEELEDYVGRELGAVTEKLSKEAVECPNVTKNLKWAEEKGYPMSVVSTSAKSRVVASLKKCNLSHFFGEGDDKVYSAASSLNPPSSKPDPKIYNFACEELGVKNAEAITVEDSKSGATAAMRAGIPCIAYVGIYGLEDGKEKEDEMAKKLTEETKCFAVMRDWNEFPSIIENYEKTL